MTDFLLLPPADQVQILRVGSDKLKRASNLLEKDVWICWALKQLFTMPGRHKMCFKGGTSLSKAYDAINRFSEDIDVTVDYKKLMGEEHPDATSRSQASKLSKELRAKLEAYLKDEVTPFLSAQAATEFPERKLKINLDSTGENIILEYDSVLEGPTSQYVPNTVRLEFGGRNLTDPSTVYLITPYLKSMDLDVDFPEATVDVLAIQRTFWEKATAIHVECNRTPPRLPERFSRHWSDLLKIAAHSSGQDCFSDKVILRSVIDHKSLFFYTATANYEACISGGLQLTPDGAVLRDLEKDYKQMVDERMFYDEPLSFEELMKQIVKLEKRINDNFSSNN